MKINRVEYNYNSIQSRTSPMFKAYLSDKYYAFAEKKSVKAEFALRKSINKGLKTFSKLQQNFYKIFNKQKAETISESQKFINKITAIDESSHQYMGAVYMISRMFGAGKEIEINIENGEMQKIADSDESCIFIMNHDKQSQDGKMLNFFNALLSREYILKGKSETCPHPKIILNKDIIDSMDNDSQKIAQTIGAVGVDATIHSVNHVFNGRITSKLIKDLIDNKINLFIFPEGRMCAFKKLDSSWKFQGGVSDIIKAVAKQKDRVKVVPLGFAYKGNVGSIHIGEPLFFKKENDNLLFTQGTADKELSSESYYKYIQNTPQDQDGYRPILDKGEPIKYRKTRDYISGILCDNLVSCKRKAAEQIKNVGTIKDDNVLHVLEDTI